MWRAITVVLGCLLLASGCQALPSGSTATLQGAIEQYLQTSGQTRLSPVDVKITRSFDGSALVMYAYERAGSGTRLMTICTQQMYQQWLLWHAGNRGCSSRPAGPIGHALAPIDFETVSSNSGTSYTYSYQ